MIRQLGSLGRPSPRLLAVLLAALLPASAAAEMVTVRNETRGPLVVQGACVVRGRLMRDRPRLLAPGDATPAIAMPGDKVLTVYEPRNPNRVLYQGVIPAGTDDQTYRLVPDGPGGLRLEQRRPP